MSDPIRCPNCESPDTVGYWDIAESQELTIIIYKTHYPDARRCVDCGLVWWNEGQRLDAKKYRAREPEAALLMPCPPCPQCGHLHRLSKCGICSCENKEWRA